MKSSFEKGDMGGFALARRGEIPPTPLCQRGVLFRDKFYVSKFWISACAGMTTMCGAT